MRITISGIRLVMGRVIGTIAGFILCKFPLLKCYKNRLLSTWMFPEKRGRVDNLLYECLLPVWFRFEYLAEKNPDKRESLKRLCMGGEGGRKWASIYDSRQLDFEEMVGDMPYKEACPILPRLDEVLSNTTSPSVIVQVGCSSGREIAWLAQRHRGYIYMWGLIPTPK